MSPSIAGATTTGADVARHVAVDDVAGQAVGHRARASARSPARRRSRRRCRPMTMWPIRPSGSRSRTSVSTGWRDSAANDSGPTKRVAGRRQHDRHVGALGAQQAEQLDGLVGGDRAGHAEPDQPARQPAGPPLDRRSRSPSSSGSPPPTSAWRMARPLSVSSGSIASMPSSARAHGAADRPPVRIALTSAGVDAVRVGQLAPDALEQARRRAPGSRRSCPPAWR